jgi:hypothetical protein
MSDWEPVSAPAPLDLFARALGLQYEDFNPQLGTAVASFATQDIFGSAVYMAAGSIITGVKVRNTTAATGTLPTTARFGLLDYAGKVLVRSASTTALASWGAGVLAFPFTAPFTLAYGGIYFPCAVVNGAFGSNNPTLLYSNSIVNSQVADGANPPSAFVQTGQTDLPAVGSSVTISGDASGRVYWFGLY